MPGGDCAGRPEAASPAITCHIVGEKPVQLAMPDEPLSMEPAARRGRYRAALWEFLGGDLQAVLLERATDAAIAVADADLEAYFGNLVSTYDKVRMDLVACEAENARLRQQIQEAQS